MILIVPPSDTAPAASPNCFERAIEISGERRCCVEINPHFVIWPSCFDFAVLSDPHGIRRIAPVERNLCAEVAVMDLDDRFCGTLQDRAVEKL